MIPAAVVRLLLVDDHAIMREGLKQLFAMMEGTEVVAEAADGLDAMARLRDGGIDVVVLDMTMPGLSGDDLVRRIRAHHPGVSIMVLSMHDEPQIAMRAIRAGAAGYVTKDQSPQVLWEALRRVANGGRFIDPHLAQRLVLDPLADGPRPDHERLTDRELQTLLWLARGARVQEIANALCISHKTVSTHKARLMEKMNFGSMSELVRYAIAHGLIE